MLNVFLTVDTEAWPRATDWRETALARDLRRDIHGETAAGAFGVPYQLDVLRRHNLKAVFLVEALCAEVVGLDPLREIVTMIQRGGQEVQLHLHTEWLAWMRPSLLPGRAGQNMKDFTEQEQATLIGKGVENLQRCGAREVCAFRAGNYGADNATLRALARHGIGYDTSYNYPYLHTDCGMKTDEVLLQPAMIEGVREFPVTFFRTWAGSARDAQLRACSAAELEAALLEAWRRRWYSFVIVAHSFELIKGREKGAQPRPDRIVLRRFARLCRFLDHNRDKFRTCFFTDVDPAEVPETRPQRPLSCPALPTVRRYAEQLTRRVF